MSDQAGPLEQRVIKWASKVFDEQFIVCIRQLAVKFDEQMAQERRELQQEMVKLEVLKEEIGEIKQREDAVVIEKEKLIGSQEKLTLDRKQVDKERRQLEKDRIELVTVQAQFKAAHQKLEQEKVEYENQLHALKERERRFDLHETSAEKELLQLETDLKSREDRISGKEASIGNMEKNLEKRRIVFEKDLEVRKNEFEKELDAQKSKVEKEIIQRKKNLKDEREALLTLRRELDDKEADLNIKEEELAQRDAQPGLTATRWTTLNEFVDFIQGNARDEFDRLCKIAKLLEKNSKIYIRMQKPTQMTIGMKHAGKDIAKITEAFQDNQRACINAVASELLKLLRSSGTSGRASSTHSFRA